MTRRPLAFLCILCIAVFALLTFFGLPPERGRDSREEVCRLLEVPRDVTVTGEVLRSEELEDYSYFILGQAVLSVNSRNYPISNVRITLKAARHYAVGVRVSAFGVLKNIEKPTNPGQFDREFYYRLQNVRYSMSDPSLSILSSGVHLLPEIFAILREAMRERIRKSYPKDVAGIISAMILGDKSLLGDEVRSLFSMGGVSHMLAISGLHTTLFGEGFYRLLLLIPFFRNGRKKSAGLLSVIALFLYAVLTGLAVATMRAVIMFAVMRGADLAGRTYDAPTAAAFAALLIVMEQPLYVFYSGFILSFTAVAVLTIFYERGRLTVCITLFLGTLPIVLLFFYEFSTYSVLINLIVLPFMPFILLFGLFGTIFGGAVSGFFSLPAILLLRGIMFFLSISRKLPYSNFIFGRPGIGQVVLYYMLLSGFLYLLFIWRTRKIRFLLFPLIVPLVMLLSVHTRSGLSIHFLDIGQGDCCVMEMPGGQNILVDGGSSSVYDVGRNRIMPFLKYEGIRRLDYIFVTHMDSDHTSGVTELLEAIRDGRTAIKADFLVLPYLRECAAACREMAELGEEAGLGILYVRKGDLFRFEKDRGEMFSFSEDFSDSFLEIRILGPDPSVETSPVDENGQCITFALNFGDFDCLMTGDVQNAGEESLTRILRARAWKMELLKISHHGSKYSTPDEFLDIVKPEISVISCGRDNRYGHPHAELLRRLMRIGTEIVRTDEAGEIHVWTDGEKYWCEGAR